MKNAMTTEESLRKMVDPAGSNYTKDHKETSLRSWVILFLRAVPPLMSRPLHNSRVSSIASCLFTSAPEALLDFTQGMN